MEINELDIYKISKEISKDCWKVYSKLNWHDRKIIGDQFICAIDSVGANIAEGFGRFHYLDKNKFNYNARGSLLESIYWLEILKERDKIDIKELDFINKKIEFLHRKLNAYISSTKKQVGLK